MRAVEERVFLEGVGSFTIFSYSAAYAPQRKISDATIIRMSYRLGINLNV